MTRFEARTYLPWTAEARCRRRVRAWLGNVGRVMRGEYGVAEWPDPPDPFPRDLALVVGLVDLTLDTLHGVGHALAGDLDQAREFLL